VISISFTVTPVNLHIGSFWYICVHISIYLYVYKCVYVYISLYICIKIHIHIYICLYIDRGQILSILHYNDINPYYSLIYPNISTFQVCLTVGKFFFFTACQHFLKTLSCSPGKGCGKKIQ
jgi:hypothetical protein